MRSLISFALIALGWSGRTPDSPRAVHLVSDDTRAYIDDVRERWGVPGLSIAVVASPKFSKSSLGKDEWTTELLPFGKADTMGNSVTEDTLFAIGSNSKLFTILSVGLLIDNATKDMNGNTLQWDTKAKDVLREWKLQDEYASNHVDLVDLGSMRSGMPSHDIATFIADPPEAIANLRNLPPTTELRQATQYMNTHYTALSHIVPTLTDLPYIDFVQRHMFDLLDMTSTTFSAFDARDAGGVVDGFSHHGINLTRCGERSETVRDMDASCIGEAVPIGWWTNTDGVFEAGAGGIISNARDMAKWLRELLEPTVLSPTLVQKAATPISFMFGPSMEAEISDMAYGMAQVVMRYRGHRAVWHTGGVPGQTSLVLRLPYVGVGVAVLTNDGEMGPSVFDTAVYRILDDLLDLDPIDWEQRKFGHKISAPQPARPPTSPTPPKGGYGGVPAKYSHPGYPDLDLQRLGKHHPLSNIVRLHIRELALTEDPIYIAYVGTVFCSHLVLTHFDGQFFNATGIVVFTPDDEAVIGSTKTVPAVVTLKGIGMFGNFADPGASVHLNPPILDDVEQKAAVWFERK